MDRDTNKRKEKGEANKNERILTAEAKTHFQGISEKVLASGRKRNKIIKSPETKTWIGHIV